MQTPTRISARRQRRFHHRREEASKPPPQKMPHRPIVSPNREYPEGPGVYSGRPVQDVYAIVKNENTPASTNNPPKVARIAAGIVRQRNPRRFGEELATSEEDSIGPARQSSVARSQASGMERHYIAANEKRQSGRWRVSCRALLGQAQPGRRARRAVSQPRLGRPAYSQGRENLLHRRMKLEPAQGIAPMLAGAVSAP
jgi:hypothetical protein